MSSAQYIKLQSQQSGDFTATNNRLNFVIPASYGKITLKDSFVELYVNIDTADVTPATGAGVYISTLQWKNNAGVKTDNYFNNVACVRNAHLSSSRHGMVESVRRTDVLRQNLDSMRRSQSTVDSDRYINGTSLTNLVNEQQYSIFQQINKVGDVMSVNNMNVPLMIRLGDLLNFCDSNTIDFNSLGDVTIALELNIANIDARQVFPTVLAEAEKMNDIAQPAVATDVTQLTTTTLFTDKDQMPYYVGQKLDVTATVNGAADEESEGVITNITENANGSRTLTFGRTLYTLTGPAGGGMDTCRIGILAPASIGVTWNRAELVLKQELASAPVETDIMYNQFDTYELLGNGATIYNNVIEIDGRATNALIMPVNANGIDANLGSVITDFRIALNNVELTDSRSVVPYSPLYMDRLVKAMDASDYVVTNLQNAMYDTTELELYSATQTAIIGMPLFTTANRKNLQINLASGGLGSFILYTSIPRDIQL